MRVRFEGVGSYRTGRGGGGGELSFEERGKRSIFLSFPLTSSFPHVILSLLLRSELTLCVSSTVGFTKKKNIVGRLFNSYVANNVRFANRNSLDMAPPLACCALTMVRFPTKKCDDGLPG
jgi:hypothetical protein